MSNWVPVDAAWISVSIALLKSTLSDDLDTWAGVDSSHLSYPTHCLISLQIRSQRIAFDVCFRTNHAYSRNTSIRPRYTCFPLLLKLGQRSVQPFTLRPL